ncbi:NADH-quinone oxidoreductase subunit C [Alicyclobacillus cycloheptanicus]|uniref:NADH-quinone oxidoreductase n=1 Tax=Alicyclobacillus cycloheptanicus TaxID=1457 RepID=A0ABT9XGI0_9BACL|nr:NADH-quinone oxidoreductase subunit C [Alicyclobacillus cycloheptanicus]MDQ0189415.1 NADH-quinone oxidoreductase subunit C [Alicyclobacillus cycloheptanicus]WDM02288.1 NADH-quinone oxidoreductase subunit C [Alicyclobacillus cycloheptanicus]
MTDEERKGTEQPITAEPADRSGDAKSTEAAEAAQPAPEAKPAEAVEAAQPVPEAKPDAKPASDAKPAARPAPKPAAAKPAGAAAKPASKPAPPPDPRVEAAKAEAEKLKAALVEKFGEGVVEETGAALHTPMVVIAKDRWYEAVDFLRTNDAWKLNYIECMVGTDYPAKGYIEIVIYVQSTSLGHWVCLKTRTDRDRAEVPSLVPSHPGVNWEEREIYDLLGVTFTNHPDLRRIMLWDEFAGHPLRKDYNEWQGGEDSDGAGQPESDE